MSKIVLFMMLSYLIQTYASNPGIVDLPLALYLKEILGLSAQELANFQTIGFLPWTVKPLWGIIIDGLPLFSYPIKSYFLVCYASAVATFWGLSQIERYTTSILLTGFSLISICVACSDVLADKLMIMKGKPQHETAVLQAAQWAAAGFGGAVMYYLSGWIARNLSLSAAFLLSAFVPLIGLIATLLLLTERKVPRGTVSLQQSLQILWTAVRSRSFLATLGFTIFLALSPAPPLLFYQRDVLNFTEDFLGSLGAIWSLAFGLGAVVFGLFAPKLSRKMLLNSIVGMSAIATLALMFIVDPQSAILVQAFNGLTYAIALLASLEIIVGVCPAGAEGMSYALLLSASNLAVSGGSIAGGWLYDQGIAFPILVGISAVFTSLCWFLIPLLKLEHAEL